MISNERTCYRYDRHHYYFFSNTCTFFYISMCSFHHKTEKEKIKNPKIRFGNSEKREKYSVQLLVDLY